MRRIKFLLAVIACFMICSNIVEAQRLDNSVCVGERDKILGSWRDVSTGVVYEFERQTDSTYCAVIKSMPQKYYVGGETPKDICNLDRGLRMRELLGLECMSQIEYDASVNVWESKTIYAIEKGYFIEGLFVVKDSKLYFKGTKFGKPSSQYTFERVE